MRKTTVWLVNRPDINRAVQAQKMARSLKFLRKKKRDYTLRVAKTKGLISFAVTAKLICVFVLAYANCWFSHVEAHFCLTDQTYCCLQRFYLCYNLS